MVSVGRAERGKGKFWDGRVRKGSVLGGQGEGREVREREYERETGAFFAWNSREVLSPHRHEIDEKWKGRCLEGWVREVMSAGFREGQWD